MEIQLDELTLDKIGNEGSFIDYADLFQYAPISYIVLSNDGIVIEINSSATILFGKERYSIIDKSFRSLIHHEDHAIYDFVFTLLNNNKSKTSCELRICKFNGSVFTAKCDFLMRQTPGNGEEQIFGIITEHTAQYIEHEFEGSTNYTSSLHSNANEGWWEWNLENNSIFISPNLLIKLGYATEDVYVESSLWKKIIHPDDLKQFNHLIIGVEKDYIIKLRLWKKDGSNYDVVVKGYFNRNEIGKAIRIVGSITAYNKKKLLNEAFLTTENKYRKLHESMIDGFVFVDMDGLIIEFNEVYARMIGYDANEIYKLTYKDITPSKWHEFENRILTKQIIPNGHSEVYEKEYLRKSGEVFPVELRTVLVKDDLNENIGMWAIVRDITERKRIEKLILEREEQYRLLVENQTDYIVKVGLKGHLLYVSPSFCELIGKSEKELQGSSLKSLMIVEDQDIVKKSIELILKPPYTCYFDVRTKTRLSWRWISWSAKALYDENNTPNYFVGIGRDITEQKLIEDELRQSEILRVKTIEHLKMSSELHDHIGHLIVSNKLRMERCLILSKNPEMTRELKSAFDHHIELMKEIRQYSKDLTLDKSSKFNLEKDILSLLSEFEQINNIKVSKKIDSVFNQIPYGKCNSIFRIFEEAITNIIKHSGASLISIQIYVEMENFYLVIKNDGNKIGDSINQCGRGLNFMKQRALEIGGELKISTLKRKFFEVKLVLPLV